MKIVLVILVLIIVVLVIWHENRISAFLWCCSAAQSCPPLCDPMDCSMLGFPVLHYLPDFSWTHVHWVSNTIQPSRPLFSPSPPAFNLSQHQGLFQWVGSCIRWPKASASASLSNEYSKLVFSAYINSEYTIKAHCTQYYFSSLFFGHCICKN